MRPSEAFNSWEGELSASISGMGEMEPTRMSVSAKEGEWSSGARTARVTSTKLAGRCSKSQTHLLGQGSLDQTVAIYLHLGVIPPSHTPMLLVLHAA